MTSQTLSSTNGHRSAPTTNGPNGTRPAQQGQPPAATPRPSVIQMLREADAAERSHPHLPAAGFSPQQIEALSAPLNPAKISSREQGRGRVSYLQSFVVLQEANRIFGFDGWQRQTLFCRCVSQAERLIGREQKPVWGVTYIARVRITVSAGAHGSLIREGTGAGHGIDIDLGLAHESAIKEAETDAMKRALVTFGNPFGLALYDKSLRQVDGAQRPTEGTGAQPWQGNSAPSPRPQTQPQRPEPPGPGPVWVSSKGANPIAAAFNGPPRSNGRSNSAPQATARPQTPAPTGQRPQPKAESAGVDPDALLDPAIALQLQEQLKALSPGHRDAFSRAFRAAFQVPESTPSVAGLICQERHRIWIQEFLAKATRG